MEGVTLGVHGTYIVSAAATVGPGGVRVAIGCVSARARARDGASRSALRGAELTPEAVHAAVAGLGDDARSARPTCTRPPTTAGALTEVCCERAVLAAAKRAKG